MESAVDPKSVMPDRSVAAPMPPTACVTAPKRPRGLAATVAAAMVGRASPTAPAAQLGRFLIGSAATSVTVGMAKGLFGSRARFVSGVPPTMSVPALTAPPMKSRTSEPERSFLSVFWMPWPTREVPARKLSRTDGFIELNFWTIPWMYWPCWASSIWKKVSSTSTLRPMSWR